jgi:CheY-like chemotaxis protein
MPPRVLIVEDEAQVALGIRDLLSLEGFDTMIAGDGASVAAAVASFHPDVVLLDVSLPDINGFEVYAMLTEHWPDLPVIFSTGHATEKDLEQLPRSRFVSLLRKPYDFSRLLAEVSRALQA